MKSAYFKGTSTEGYNKHFTVPEYNILLDKLKNGENIMICEIDVPTKNKKGNFGKDYDENNICHMSIEKLEILLNDTTEAFGHGLALAYSLLLDLDKSKMKQKIKTKKTKIKIGT